MSTTPRHTRNNGWAGIGLLILLIAVAIILYLVAKPAGGPGSPAGIAQQAIDTKQTADTFSIGVQAKALADAVAVYRLANNNTNPDSTDDLTGSARAYQDPWGTPLRFTITGQRRDLAITVRSAGPDTEWDTEDDIETTRPLSF